jgi:hypothetical protein
MRTLKPSAVNKPVPSKFQADLAASDAAALLVLKEQLEVRSNADFLSEAIAFMRWAVGERRRGSRILSESRTGERSILITPSLERVAPQEELPFLELHWTSEQLAAIAQFMSATPAPPTPELKRAIKRV